MVSVTFSPDKVDARNNEWNAQITPNLSGDAPFTLLAWPFEELENALYKIRNILLVQVETRKENDNSSFYRYRTATLLSKPNMNKFLDAIEQGITTEAEQAYQKAREHGS